MVPTPCGLVWISVDCATQSRLLGVTGTQQHCKRWLHDRATLSPPRQARLLGPGGFERAAAWPFRIGRGINNMEFLIGVVVGFVLGYGVREGMSRYRRARARRQRGYTEL